MNKTLENILILEGGYVDNPKDKGGATNWGITEATARKHGFLNDMRDLTRSEAYAILEEDYWIKPGFKDVANLSESIAFELCDAAVNIGQHHPVLWLQRWLNVLNREERSYQDIVVDGKIGPYTMATLHYYLTVRGKEGEEVLVKALNCSQGAWYLSLAEKNQQNEEFIYGWMKNRVSLHTELCYPPAHGGACLKNKSILSFRIIKDTFYLISKNFQNGSSKDTTKASGQ